jgi:hypothetical protein
LHEETIRELDRYAAQADRKNLRRGRYTRSDAIADAIAAGLKVLAAMPSVLPKTDPTGR